MEAELKALGPHMPDGLRARLLAEGKGGKGEEEGCVRQFNGWLG